MANPSLKVSRVAKALGAEVRGFDMGKVDSELAGGIWPATGLARPSSSYVFSASSPPCFMNR